MFLETISDRVGFEVVSVRGIVFSSGIFLASVSGMFIFPLYMSRAVSAYNQKEKCTNDIQHRSPFTSWAAAYTIYSSTHSDTFLGLFSREPAPSHM